MTIRLGVLLLFVAAAQADSGAALAGTVKDPQGRAVLGAALTLVSRTGGAGGATTTGASGAYQFRQLPGGDYLLRVEASGFAPALIEDVHLATGATATRDIALQLAGVRQEVVVTASSTPQAPEEVSKAVTVISQSDADARDNRALADVVDLAPAVRVQQLGGPGALTTIQIRGMRDEDTAVLVDGLRLRDASATQADASGLIEDLLFTDASRVEVMRGSGSSLYGTNAIGGVVNVITGEGGGRTRGSVLLEGGSLDAFRGRAKVAGQWAGGRIEYSFGVAQSEVTAGLGGDQPFRDTNTQGRITFHLSPNVQLVARMYAGNSFGKIFGSPDVVGSASGVGIVNAIASGPNATFLPAPDDPDYTRAARFLTGALVLTGQPSPGLDYSVSYQIVANSRRYGDGPAGVGYQPTSSTRSLYDGRIQTANAHLNYHPRRWNLLTAGYEFESETYANDNSQQFEPDAASAVNVTQRSHTVFAQDQARFFNDQLQISGAVRAQFFTLNPPVFTPLASAPYQGASFPAPPAAYTGDGSAAWFFRRSATKVRAHVGRGYRAPSLFERFGAGYDPVYGYSVYGDPRLTPEHSIGFDTGVDRMFFSGRLKASATYFYTALQNVINFDTSGLINPATDPWGRYIGYLNTRGGISRGVETSAALAPTRSLNITAAYSYIDAIERTPIVSNVLETFVVPKNQFSVVATARVTPRLLLIADTRQSSDYVAPVYGSLITQVYRFNGLHKVNLGASYQIPLSEFRAIRIFARAENVLNQTYFESGYPTPGRTAMGGMQFDF
ncbi:MAG TPA: TonB-dependent receptor [Bryobacteraceae bacterium]|nr:TonB-dependent receptor [Bryobacteraceae bacterium]